MKRISVGGSQRLALDKETLRTLGDADLRDAVGGMVTATSASVVGSIVLSLASAATVSISTALTSGCPADPQPPAPPKEPK